MFKVVYPNLGDGNNANVGFLKKRLVQPIPTEWDFQRSLIIYIIEFFLHHERPCWMLRLSFGPITLEFLGGEIQAGVLFKASLCDSTVQLTSVEDPTGVLSLLLNKREQLWEMFPALHHMHLYV